MREIVESAAPTSVGDTPGVLARWRVRSSERRRQRLVSAVNRRRLANSLRRAARQGPGQSRYSALLADRAAAVRAELLELAAMLELAGEPDASWVGQIRDLMTDGCKSPLFNPDVHISELLATLYYLRAAGGP
jgi:hypothetical protein